MKNNIILTIKNKFRNLNNFSELKSKEVSYISILDKLISFFLFSGIFLFPLIFSAFLESANTFELHKLTFLKIYVILLFFLFVIREINQISPIWKNIQKIFKKYYLFPTLFIVLFGISILFSSDIATSFFGKIDRQQGYLSYILYFLWFIFFSLELIRNKYLKKKSNLNLYLFSFVLSGFVASVYGILQYLGIDFLIWSEPAYLTKRSFSSLGQPNFFASWLLLILPLSLALGLKTKKEKVKIFLFFVSFVNLLALFTTGSRAAWLSLIFTVFLLFIKLMYVKKLSTKTKVVSVVLILFFALGSLYLIEHQSPGRISQMFDVKKGSTSARVDFYSVAARAISKKPIVGYGVENIQQTYAGYYNPNWGVHSDVNQVPDRAHNLILDILMAGGLILFIAYVFLYVDFYRKYKHSLVDDKNKLIVNALFFGVVSYLFSLLFGFSIPSGELYFFSYLAILTYFAFSNDFKDNILPEFRANSFSKKYKITILIFLVFICSFLVYRSFTPLLSNYYFTKAMEKHAKGEYGQMTILLDYSQEMPNNRAWQSFYAQKYGEAIASIYPSGELVKDFFLEKELQDADRFLYGSNFRNLSSKIIVKNSLNDNSVKNYVDMLRKVSANLPQSNMIIANYYANIGEYEKAREYYNKALDNLPDVGNKNLNLDHLQTVRNNYYKGYLSIANNYFKMGEYDRAIDNYRKAYFYNPQDYLIFKKIADIYFIQKDYQKVIPEVKKGMRLSPEDYTWPLLLHYTYEELNNAEMSDFWLEKAKSLGYEKTN